MKKLILFDLDGTLLDSLDTVCAVLNEIAVEHGYQEMADREHIRKYSSHELVKAVGVPFWKVPFFIKKYRESFAHRFSRLKLIVGVKEELEKLQGRATLGIITSNTEDTVKKNSKKTRY